MSSTPQPHPSPVSGQPQLMPHPQQPSPGAASVQQHQQQQQHIPITLSAQQHQQLMAQPQTMQYQGVEVTVHQAPPAIAPAPMAVTPTGQHVNQQGMYSQAIQQHPGVGAAPMSQLIQQAAATSMASMPTQVQVIQQPMNPTYLQHMYSPQGPLIMGNVVHQPGLGGSIQLIAAGKPINGAHMISGGKAVLQQGQGGFGGGYTIPTSNNGTLVMLSQANLLQTQSKQNDLAKMAAAAGQRLPIHKQLAVSGAVSVQHQTMQHQSQHPQLVTTQAGGHHGHHQLPMMASPSQIISPLQAFGQMPQGWGTMPQAFYIRPTGAPGGAGGQTQEGMFIQSPPQHPQLQQPQMSADPNQLRFPTAVTSMASVTQAVQPQQLQQPQPAVQQPATAVMSTTKPTIQPKLATQRPLILPNMQTTGSPMRPGGMVGPSAMGMQQQQQQQPRPQHKGRMKPTASRMAHPNLGAAGGGLAPPRTAAPPSQQVHQPRLAMPTSGVAPMSAQLLPSAGSPNPDGPSTPATPPVAALKPRASPKPKSPKSSSTAAAAAAAAAAASIQHQLQHQQAVAASAAGVVRPQQQQQVLPVSQQQQHVRVTSSGVAPMVMTAPVSRTTVASSVASLTMPSSSVSSPQCPQTSSATNAPSTLTSLSLSSLNHNGGLSTTAVGAVSEITAASDGTPLPATLPVAPHGRSSTPSSVGLPVQQSPAMTPNSHALPPRAAPVSTAAPSTKRLQNGEVKALPGMASIGADTKGKVPLPKAMVKPHVLTHVIDGFVIQEAAEPFPVNKGVTCDSKTITGKENHPETDVDAKKRSNGVVGVGCLDGPLGQGSADTKKKIKRDKAHAPPTSPAAAGTTNAAATPSGKKHGRKNSEQSSDSAASPPAAKRPRTASDPAGPDPAEAPDHCLTPAASDSLEEAGDGASVSQDKNSSAEPTTNPDKPNPITWNVDDVVDFIRNLPGCGDYAEDFALQEIDGQALMLLRADHLMQAMSIRLGPALKICAKIDSMRAALQPQQ